MLGAIIIVHQSEVIREGIAAILRQNQFTGIVLFEDLIPAKKQLQKNAKNAILLIEDKLITDRLRFAVGQHHIVLSIEENQEVRSGTYNINASVQTLLDQLNTLIQAETRMSARINQLTERETEVLQLLAFGHSNKDIAEKLFISIHTVISHRKNITEKLGIKSVSGLTVYAIINNLIDTEGLNLEDLI